MAKGPRVIHDRFLRVVGVFLALAATALRAHDPGISTMQGELRNDVLVLVTGFAPADASLFLPQAARKDGSWDQADFDAVRAELLRIASRLWEVKAGESLLTPREQGVELLPGDNVSFRLVFVRPSGSSRFELRAPLLKELSDSHRQFVIIADEAGSVIAKKLLSTRDSVIEIGATTPGGSQPPPSDSATIWGFIRLGVVHIWTGYDHLLFLLALLVVCTGFRSSVAIISCFTLAHSITLALSALDIVVLPPWLARCVEPAIAASIVFVGVENILRRGAEPRGRWLLTFAFGLVHGFGFASVLRDLGLGTGGQGIAMPLLTFNLGVELGQIAIAAVVLPLLWRLRRNETFVARGVPAISAVVALAGLWWLLDRTVL